AAGWLVGAGLTAGFFPFGCWATRMAGARRQETPSANTRGIMRISEEGVAAESVKRESEQYTGRELRVVPEPRSLFTVDCVRPLRPQRTAPTFLAERPALVVRNQKPGRHDTRAEAGV